MIIDESAYERFDNTKIELVRSIQKRINTGMCRIKSALVITNYDMDKSIELLNQTKWQLNRHKGL